MGEQERVKTPAAHRPLQARRRVISAIILLVILAGMLSVFLFRERLDEQAILKHIGYPIIALLSFVGSASIFIPVPGILAVCWGGMLLSVPIVAVVAGTAEALGELTGYAAGFGGRGLLDEGRIYRRLKRWMARRGSIVLFVLSVIPNPVFDVAGVAAGALRYPIWKFLIVIWLGKCIKSFGVAYSCASGVEWVLRFINVS